MLPISDKPAHSTMTNRELAGIRRPRLVRFCSPHAAEKRALDTWINNSDSSATSWNRCQRRCRGRSWWRQAISTSMRVCSRSRARTGRGAHGRAVARRRCSSLLSALFAWKMRRWWPSSRVATVVLARPVRRAFTTVRCVANLFAKPIVSFSRAGVLQPALTDLENGGCGMLSTRNE